MGTNLSVFTNGLQWCGTEVGTTNVGKYPAARSHTAEHRGSDCPKITDAALKAVKEHCPECDHVRCGRCPKITTTIREKMANILASDY